MAELFSLDLHRYVLPLRETLQIGPHRLQQREGLVLVLRDRDGTQGVGEIAPLPGLHEESLDAIYSTLQRQKPMLLALLEVVYELLDPRCWVPPSARKLIAPPLRAMTSFHHHLEPLHLPPSARFGLDMMLWTYRAHLCLRAKQPSRPPKTHATTEKNSRTARVSHDLYTPNHPTLPLQVLLMGPLDALQKQAADALHTGVRHLKLKVGRTELAEDIKRVRALHDLLGKQATLRIDPNRAWTLDQARRFLDALHSCPIEYLEEPLQNPLLLPQLVQETGVSVALDESLSQLHPKSDDPRLACAKTLVLKPSVLGGVLPTDDWLLWSQMNQRAAVFSSTFESGLGLSFLALWAASVLPHRAAGLDTRRALAADLLPPWSQGGHLNLSSIANHLACFDITSHPNLLVPTEPSVSFASCCE